MSRLGIADQQFGLAMINRVSSRANALAWRQAAGGGQAACELEGFRIHLDLIGGAGLPALTVSDRDGWPIMRLSAGAFAPAHQAFVATILEYLQRAALERLPTPGAEAAERAWGDPMAEDARLAGLVKRLSARPDPAMARRGWLAALSPRAMGA